MSEASTGEFLTFMINKQLKEIDWQLFFGQLTNEGIDLLGTEILFFHTHTHTFFLIIYRWYRTLTVCTTHTHMQCYCVHFS